MTPEDRAYLAGLIDGEGHFGIAVRETYAKTRGRWQRTAHFQFVIVLREDDLPVLEWVHSTLGMGKIYLTNTDLYNPGMKAHKGNRFIIRKKAECAKLIRLLQDAPLRSKKKDEFELWAQAVRLAHQLGRGCNHGEANSKIFMAINDIATKMATIRKTGRDLKDPARLIGKGA